MLEHRPLGATGIEVSRIALGSWRTFERMERADVERLLAHAIKAGIDFLDDARYDDETGSAPLSSGYSEVLFGQLLRAVGAVGADARAAPGQIDAAIEAIDLAERLSDQDVAQLRELVG